MNNPILYQTKGQLYHQTHDNLRKPSGPIFSGPAHPLKRAQHLTKIGNQHFTMAPHWYEPYVPPQPSKPDQF